MIHLYYTVYTVNGKMCHQDSKIEVPLQGKSENYVNGIMID